MARCRSLARCSDGPHRVVTVQELFNTVRCNNPTLLRRMGNHTKHVLVTKMLAVCPEPFVVRWSTVWLREDSARLD
eukprot:3233828-Prorocentrum_lima.AAC.1